MNYFFLGGLFLLELLKNRRQFFASKKRGFFFETISAYLKISKTRLSQNKEAFCLTTHKTKVLKALKLLLSGTFPLLSFTYQDWSSFRFLRLPELASNLGLKCHSHWYRILVLNPMTVLKKNNSSLPKRVYFFLHILCAIFMEWTKGVASVIYLLGKNVKMNIPCTVFWQCT